jgi:TonB family protein
MIKFTLLQTGQVKNITILKSSGVTAIDEAALKTIQMATPFQKLPPSFTREQPFAIPITYR